MHDLAAPRVATQPDAPRIATPCGTSSSLGCPAHRHSVWHVFITRMPRASPLRVARLHHRPPRAPSLSLAAIPYRLSQKLLRVRTSSTLGELSCDSVSPKSKTTPSADILHTRGLSCDSVSPKLKTTPSEDIIHTRGLSCDSVSPKLKTIPSEDIIHTRGLSCDSVSPKLKTLPSDERFSHSGA
jgi:hypothetical protein